MKTIFYNSRKSAVLFMIMSLFFAANTFAQLTATESGNWDDTDTWGGSSVPTSSDDVQINPGVTVTVNVTDAACKTLQIGTSPGTAVLQFNASSQLTVSGLVRVGQSSGGNNRFGQLRMTSGGKLICTSLAVGFSNASNTFTRGSGTIELTATNTLPASTFTTFNNLIISGGTTTTGRALTIASLTVNSADTFSLSHAVTANAVSLEGGCAVTGGTISGSSTLTLGGNVAVTDNTGGTAGATISCPVALGGATRTFTVADDGTSATDLTMSGVISGATFGVTKAGAGTLRLSGSNTYTGTTTISQGTISAGTIVVSSSASHLGNAPSAVVLGGSSTSGSLSYTGSAATFTRGFTVNAGGGSIINTTANLLTIGTGGIATTGEVNLSNTSTGGTTISSVISSTGSLIINNSGTGVTTLSGTNTYSGGTSLSAGSLTIGNTAALGSTSGAFSISGTGVATVSSNVSVGSLTIGGLGTASGTWGSSTSSATYKNNVFLSTGLVTVGTNTRTNPTVTPTVGTYTYDGSAQGPDVATNTGTGTTYTYSYAGVAPTVYGPSTTRPTNAGSYTVTVSVAANGNFAAATSSATAFTINQKALTITGLTGTNKTFNGTTAATATGTAALSGVISPDVVTLSGTPVFTFASENVGTAISISTSGYSLSGANAANYTLTQPTLSANITATTVTVTPIVGTYTYSGSAQGPNTATNTGTGTSYTYSYAGVAPTVYGPSDIRPTNAGSYTVTVTVAANGNFAAASSSATAFTIAVKALTITANNQTKCFGTTFTFAGTEFTTSGLVGGNTVTSATLSSTGSASSATASTYPIVPTNAAGTGLANYTITYVNGTLTFNASPDISNFSIGVTNPAAGGTSTVTINSNSLANGTYTVTYNLTGDNTATGSTASVTIATGTGTFATSALATAGYTTITITAIKNAANCSSTISSGNTATILIPTVGSTTITTTGTWTAPVGVTSVTVEAWGGGGAGGGTTNAGSLNANAGGGGGGGAYATKVINVTPSQTLNIVVGAGGIGNSGGNGGNGGNSTITQFNADILAEGGKGGISANATTGNANVNGGSAGLVANSLGTTITSGSNGGIGTRGYGISSGAGGAAASPGGGAGGASITGLSVNADGNPGVAPGGGGGGSRTSENNGPRTGGAGGNGQVKITYEQLTYKSEIISTSLGSTNWCAGETRDVTVTIKNIGTATWTDGSGGTPTINIGVKWNTNTTNWADYYVRTSANNLAPGETGTYTLTITASNNTGSGYTTALAAGTNNLIFDVVYEGIFWFGNNNGGVGPGNTVFTSANQTINALPTVTSATGNSKTYTGSINTTTVSAVAIAGATIDWYDASTGGTLLASGTLTYAPTAINVGTYTVYAQARNTTTGCTSAARTSATITINKAVLTITAAAQTLSYGTAATTVTGGGSYTPTGFVNNETSSVIGGSATYTTTYTATTAAATSGVTITPIVTGLTATNYSFSAANGTITISTAALIITANNGSKTYGQTFTTGAGSANFTSSGLLNSETIGSITIASTGAISSAAVGSYEIIPSAATGGNFTASNYAISYTNGTLTVLPSAPIITITQPTCALQTGSVVLSGLPATGTWTLTRSSDSNQTTGTGTTITGLASGKYTFTVSIDDFTSEASEVEIYATTNTWNVIAGDGSWSNTLTNTQEITFDGDYNSTGDLSACSCQVTSGAVVINPGHTLKVTNAVTVSGGSLTFENNASLVQTNENPTINSGNIIYKRTTSTLSNNYDFVYWSSPVKEQKIGKIWMASNWADTFYNYDPTPNIPGWARSYATTPMIAGKGYISRARNGQSGVDYADVTSPPFIVGEKWTAKFYGVPNNGTITVTDCKAGKDCLLGNPYPSALDADAFLYENREVLEGTLYFWTHTTPMNNNAYNSNDYASYNFSGSVATAARGNLVNGDPNDNNKPTGKIAAGQSFFATAKGTANVEFKNAMRLSTVGAPLDNTQFFRTSSAKAKTANSIEKNRVWLNVSNTKGAFKQTLVGYVTDATNAYDSRFDGESFGGNTYVDFYSINQGKNFTIQGRSLPFDQNDTVPLGFKTTIEGSFTIDIDEVDGLLTNQAVYLEDKVTNTVSNLKNGNYTFTTAKGTFNDRFVLRYTDTDTTLSIDDTDQEDGILVFYSNNYKTLIIKNKVMDSTVNSVALFNMAGQNIEKWDVKDSGQTNIQIPIKNIPSGIYIVKVKTTKGESSKKIIVN